MTRLLIACLAALLGGCLLEYPNDPIDIPDEPRLEVRRIRADDGQVTREYWFRRYETRRATKHGMDFAWYPDGTPRWQRAYDEGEPAGLWRSWHENGALQSETDFEVEESTMTFWHPNGTLSARGPGRAGSRHGLWRHWYDTGDLFEKGTYVGSLREGVWRRWIEGGSVVLVAQYERNKLVGEWGPESR